MPMYCTRTLCTVHQTMTQQNKQHSQGVMVSSQLKDQLPDAVLNEEILASLDSSFVHIVIDKSIGSERIPLVGAFRSVLVDEKPELELKVELQQAFEFAALKSSIVVESFDVLRGEERVLTVTGPFIVPAARVQDLDHVTQTCVLMLQLERMVSRQVNG